MNGINILKRSFGETPGRYVSYTGIVDRSHVLDMIRVISGNINLQANRKMDKDCDLYTTVIPTHYCNFNKECIGFEYSNRDGQIAVASKTYQLFSNDHSVPIECVLAYRNHPGHVMGINLKEHDNWSCSFTPSGLDNDRFLLTAIVFNKETVDTFNFFTNNLCGLPVEDNYNFRVYYSFGIVLRLMKDDSLWMGEVYDLPHIVISDDYCGIDHLVDMASIKIIKYLNTLTPKEFQSIKFHDYNYIKRNLYLNTEKHSMELIHFIEIHRKEFLNCFPIDAFEIKKEEN